MERPRNRLPFDGESCPCCRAPGILAEDALFFALALIHAHGERFGFPRGALARLHAMGEHVEGLLPWLRWGEEVPPCEN